MELRRPPTARRSLETRARFGWREFVALGALRRALRGAPPEALVAAHREALAFLASQGIAAQRLSIQNFEAHSQLLFTGRRLAFYVAPLSSILKHAFLRWTGDRLARGRLPGRSDAAPHIRALATGALPPTFGGHGTARAWLVSVLVASILLATGTLYRLADFAGWFATRSVEQRAAAMAKAIALMQAADLESRLKAMRERRARRERRAPKPKGPRPLPRVDGAASLIRGASLAWESEAGETVRLSPDGAQAIIASSPSWLSPSGQHGVYRRWSAAGPQWVIGPLGGAAETELLGPGREGARLGFVGERFLALRKRHASAEGVRLTLTAPNGVETRSRPFTGVREVAIPTGSDAAFFLAPSATARRVELVRARLGDLASTSSEPWEPTLIPERIFALGSDLVLVFSAEANRQVAWRVPVVGGEAVLGARRTFDIRECARDGRERRSLALVGQALWMICGAGQALGRVHLGRGAFEHIPAELPFFVPSSGGALSLEGGTRLRLLGEDGSKLIATLPHRCVRPSAAWHRQHGLAILSHPLDGTTRLFVAPPEGTTAPLSVAEAGDGLRWVPAGEVDVRNPASRFGAP